MLFIGRPAIALAFLALTLAPAARAQDPVTPQDRSSDRVCCGRFHFRMPRTSFRAMRPMHFDRMDRMDMGRFRMRALERSMARLDRGHGREFAMRDRALGRRMELRERAMERMHGRLDRMRLERPMRMRRHWRTI
jgi:hypothetical protein